MEKNTVIAVVLCSVLLIGSFAIQGFLSQRRQAQVPVVQTQDSSGVTGSDTMPVTDIYDSLTMDQNDAFLMPPVITEMPFSENQMELSAQSESTPMNEYKFDVDIGVATVWFTNVGGDIVSWKLNNHIDKDDNVDMIFAPNNTRAFSIAFGDAQTAPVSDIFHVDRTREAEGIVEFSRVFNIATTAGTSGSFRLIKRYEFERGEYRFKLTVTLTDMQSLTGINFNGSAYTLSFGPQIGPRFNKLDRFYDYRENHTYIGGKLKKAKDNDVILDNRMTAWASISGKYFAFIAIPKVFAEYTLGFSNREEPGLQTTSRFFITRSAINVPRVDDTYFFYLGPKTLDELRKYDQHPELREDNLSKLASSRGILAPLERVLKWMLQGLYKVVRNYGIAIILLTLIIKILFFPLTKKGSQATLRMQALAPKIKELQEKYKDNPKKLQAEMANFYKQEGYNPLAGCLPMLLQIPIFIAMYGLFNNHFELRGASFIPGWIPDLSVPEFLVQFTNFRVPILNWDALRALPFIYVGSQLLYGKVTQMPGQQSATQMKFMLYVMPIIFFFILYNVPSGLLIYWIFSNLFTLVQQVIIQKYFNKKKPAQAQAQTESDLKIAPGKKKKKF